MDIRPGKVLCHYRCVRVTTASRTLDFDLIRSSPVDSDRLLIWISDDVSIRRGPMVGAIRIQRRRPCQRGGRVLATDSAIRSRTHFRYERECSRDEVFQRCINRLRRARLGEERREANVTDAQFREVYTTLAENAFRENGTRSFRRCVGPWGGCCCVIHFGTEQRTRRTTESGSDQIERAID